MPAGMLENLVAPIWPILTPSHHPLFCNHPFHSEGWSMWSHNRHLFPTIQSNIKVYNTNYCNPYCGGERDALRSPWMYCTCIYPFPVSRLREAVSRIPSDPHLLRYLSKNERRGEVHSQALSAIYPSADTIHLRTSKRTEERRDDDPLVRFPRSVRDITSLRLRCLSPLHVPVLSVLAGPLSARSHCSAITSPNWARTCPWDSLAHFSRRRRHDVWRQIPSRRHASYFLLMTNLIIISE